MNKVEFSEYVAWLKIGSLVQVTDEFSKDDNKLTITEESFDSILSLLNTRNMDLYDIKHSMTFRVIEKV